MKKEFPDHIFKAYDVRGVYPTELDETLAYKIGRAFVTLLQDEYKSKERLKIVISSDMRISSPSLKKSLIDGVIDQGVIAPAVNGYPEVCVSIDQVIDKVTPA